MIGIARNTNYCQHFSKPIPPTISATEIHENLIDREGQLTYGWTDGRSCRTRWWVARRTSRQSRRLGLSSIMLLTVEPGTT